MVGTLLKMLVFAGAALIFATKSKIAVGIPTLLVSMALYLIYTWLEIKWTQKKK
jgi:Na+/phosphate symporter